VISPREEQGLGADALALNRERLDELARGSRAGVKCWLMNQGVMAGLGNVYSDEILFRARLYPKTRVATLDADTRGRLFEALSTVLRISIESGADPARMPPDFLTPHREPGAARPGCGGAVAQLNACGRTCYYCPACQPPPDRS
jgi:formamidopyrimidine-DNA glycosylase